MDHVVCLVFLAVAVSPSGFLAGSVLFFFFLLLLFIHDPDIAFLIMHRYVLQVSLAKRALPQLENRAQIFTSHLPIMD